MDNTSILASKPERLSWKSRNAIETVDFEQIPAEIWDGVLVQQRTPMQQHIWARAAAEALSPNRPVHVIWIGSPNTPQALAPLMQNEKGLPRLSLLGAEELGEPVQVLFAGQSSLDDLATGLRRTGMSIGFGHYLVETPFIEALKRAYRGRGLIAVRPLGKRAAPYIMLNDDWLEPETTFNARRRSDFRRMQRTAAKFGEVTTQILTPSPADLPRLLDEAFAVENSSWKGRSGTAIAKNSEQEKFYRIYSDLAARAGILRLCFLRIDSKAVAMQIAVETEGSFWLFKIGYDEAYKKCSPGNLLLRETIRYSAQRKLRSFEFLGKEAPWTQLWTEEAHPIAALRTYPINVSGLMSFISDAGEIARNRIRTKTTSS